jgi:NitT/TauT family transport system substrate-binding protein
VRATQGRAPILAASLLWLLACSGAPAATPAPAATRPAASPAPQAPAATSPATAVAQSPAPPPIPARRETVRVSRSLGLGNVLHIAAARGYFEEQGIDFQEQAFGSTADAIPALATGDLDAGSTTPNASLFNALARDIHLVLALGAGEYEANGNGQPLVARLGPEGPAVHALPELRGRRTAMTQRGTISEWALDRVLGSVGLGLDDMDITLLPFPEQVVALSAGRLDAAVLVDPFAAQAEQRQIAVRLLYTDRFIPGGQNAVMTFSDRFAHQRTAVARRYAVAYLHGIRDFMDAMEYGKDRELVVGILAQASGVAPEVIEKAAYVPFRRDGRVSAEGLEAMLDWMVQRGYVPQKPNLGSLLDPQFAEAAAQALDAVRGPGGAKLKRSHPRGRCQGRRPSPSPAPPAGPWGPSRRSPRTAPVRRPWPRARPGPCTRRGSASLCAPGRPG